MTNIIPNDITVSEQFKRQYQLLDSVKAWSGKTDIKEVNLERLESECGIRCRLQVTNWSESLVEWKCVDEAKFSWFALKWL